VKEDVLLEGVEADEFFNAKIKADNKVVH